MEIQELATGLLDRAPRDGHWSRSEGANVTWSRLRDEVDALDRTLGLHGIGGGSSVAVQMTPSHTLLWTVLALWRRGAQVMLLDARLRVAEGRRIAELCRPQFHIRSGGYNRNPSGFVPECEVVVTRLPGTPARSEHRLVQFSSGSTGDPKIVGRTPDSLRTEIARFAGLRDMPGPGERVLLLSSLVHSFGFIGGVLHAMSVGATLVLGGRPPGNRLADTAHRHGVAVVFGVPLHFDLMARAGRALPDLRLAVSGGEVLRPSTAAAFADRVGVPVGTAYGMTEVGIVAADLTGSYGLPAVGPVLPGLTTGIREGELRVHTGPSPYLFVDRPDLHADGWLRTFDLASTDRGVLSIGGRTDSMVSIGGLKVHLTEVEQVLRSHPGVSDAVVVFADGIEAHVGMPDPVGAAELLGWCRASLSDVKLPRRVHVHGRLPTTVNGKVVRDVEVLRRAAAGRVESPA